MIETKERIRIVGPPGSYSFELAKAISDYTNLPFIHLATLQKSMNPQAELAKILRREKWIAEGSFLHEWATSTIEDATLIIYVQTNLLTCFFRTLFSKNILSMQHYKSIFLFRREFKKWEKTHRNVRTKMRKFGTVDQAFDYYVKSTAPDINI